MLLLSEKDVRELLPMPKAIELTRETFLGLANHTSQFHPRRRLSRPSGAMLHGLQGAHGKYFGAKVYATHVKHGAYFVVLLFSAEDAHPCAMIEANHLGQIRTGAASGVATDLLARPDASVLGVIGSGFQAEAQVEAVLAVRRIERVKVWSRRDERRHEFAERCASRFGVPVAAVTTPQDAVGGAGIVITATYSKEPVVESSWIAPGTHINAIGSNQTQRRELPGDLLDRASIVATDSNQAALLEAGDLLLWKGAGFVNAPTVMELADLLTGKKIERGAADITVFKSVGLGVQDIAVGGYVYEEALKQGRGTQIPAFQS